MTENYYAGHAPQYARYLEAKDASDRALEVLEQAKAAYDAARLEQSRAFAAWRAAGEPRDLD